MSFRTLLPGGASTNGATFGFSINSRGKGLKEIRFSIGPDIMRKTKWSDKTRLRLDIDDEDPDARKGKLVMVDKDSYQARKLKVRPGTERGLFTFPWSGEATGIFGEYEALYELDNVEASTAAIIFDLPPAPEIEEENEEDQQET